MYYVMRASAPSLHRESTDSLILYMCKYNDIRESSIIYYCIYMYSVYIVCHRTQDIQL